MDRKVAPGMVWIPWAMILTRALLCPLIVLGALRGWDGRYLGLIVLVALASDIYDGVIARRLGSDTPALRLSDSAADTVFYIGVAVALWVSRPQIIRENRVLLAVLLGLEIARYGFDFWKFGKGASYHSYLAKCWGLVMAVALIAVISFNALHWMVGLSLMLGILNNIEGLAMSAILPVWRNDVKTLQIALRIRREMPENKPK